MTSEQAATITAVAAVASTAILAIAAVFAGFQVREARRLREARFRPFVVVDFDPASDPPFLRYLRRIERRGLHDIRGELDRIRRELHGWTAPGGGLRVKSPEDIRREREEWERERGQWGAGDEGGFPGPSEEGT